MIYTPEEFLKLTLEKVVENCECGSAIRESRNKLYTIEKKEVCSDCYFDKLGELVEKYPIFNPEKVYLIN